MTFIISIVVIVGAWYKRFLIVVPSLYHPLIPVEQIPEASLHYYPSVPEWFITTGTLAAALLIITLLIRYIPVIPIVETAEHRGYEVDHLLKQDKKENIT